MVRLLTAIVALGVFQQINNLVLFYFEIVMLFIDSHATTFDFLDFIR